MNLDELANAIRNVSDQSDVQRLADLFREWKYSKETVVDLNDTIERFIGNSWFEKDEDHHEIYKMWLKFRNEAILGIGGMTMNERLYWFGLVDEFDACNGDEAKLNIYKKLMATP